MKRIWWNLLRKLRIVESCPNCDSAWTGGHPNPEDLTDCIVCGDRTGKITGWVWGRVVDPFCWLGHRNVNRCVNLLNKKYEKKND